MPDQSAVITSSRTAAPSLRPAENNSNTGSLIGGVSRTDTITHPRSAGASGQLGLRNPNPPNRVINLLRRIICIHPCKNDQAKLNANLRIGEEAYRAVKRADIIPCNKGLEPTKLFESVDDGWKLKKKMRLETQPENIYEPKAVATTDDDVVTSNYAKYRIAEAKLYHNWVKRNINNGAASIGVCGEMAHYSFCEVASLNKNPGVDLVCLETDAQINDALAKKFPGKPSLDIWFNHEQDAEEIASAEQFKVAYEGERVTPGHAFIAIGREINPGIYEKTDPTTWGEACVICDPWSDAEKVYPAKEFKVQMAKLGKTAAGVTKVCIEAHHPANTQFDFNIEPRSKEN